MHGLAGQLGLIDKFAALENIVKKAEVQIHSLVLFDAKEDELAEISKKIEKYASISMIDSEFLNRESPEDSFHKVLILSQHNLHYRNS